MIDTASVTNLRAESRRTLPRLVVRLAELLNHYSVVVVLAFGIVYVCSLTFTYVEGDDAASIAFHALGRDASVQPPYSPYQGMMDRILSVLPASEPMVRLAAIGISSIAAVCMVILTMAIVFELLGVTGERRRRWFSLAVLLAMPEFFYFGLVYTPSVVAMSFILASHLVVRRVARAHWEKPRPARSRAMLALSLILFGFGAACRWDIAAYGLVIFADIAVGLGAREELVGFGWQRIRFAFLWSALAILSALLAIAISGEGVYGFLNSADVAQTVITKAVSIFTLVGSFQSLLTPASLALSVVGLFSLIRRKSKLVILVAAGFFPILPLLFTEPKMILPAIPGLLVCTVAGLNVAWNATPQRFHVVVRVLVIVSFVGPWVVGIRVFSQDTSWGPGFELKSPAVAKSSGVDESIVGETVDERSVGVRSLRLTFAGGLAVPTLEGPRPLGGHAAVLLGGGWKSLIKRIDAERQNVLEQAIYRNAPIVQDNRNSLVVVHLAEKSFKTSDPRNRLVQGALVERRFVNDLGDQVTLIYMNGRASLFDNKELDSLALVSRSETVIFYSSYSSLIKKLVEFAPEAVQPLGPFSAVLNVKLLRSALAQKLQQSAIAR
jgi:hypothetical protein